MNDLDELEKQQLRFYKLANGIQSVIYIAFFCWVITELYNMIF
jgi:hypothetical protein